MYFSVEPKGKCLVNQIVFSHYFYLLATVPPILSDLLPEVSAAGSTVTASVSSSDILEW